MATLRPTGFELRVEDQQLDMNELVTVYRDGPADAPSNDDWLAVVRSAPGYTGVTVAGDSPGAAAMRLVHVLRRIADELDGALRDAVGVGPVQ